MTVEELKIQLFEMMIPHYCYSVGAEEDQRVCLIQDGGKWLVYFCEEGEKLDLKEFSDEAEACAEMLARLSE